MNGVLLCTKRGFFVCVHSFCIMRYMYLIQARSYRGGRGMCKHCPLKIFILKSESTQNPPPSPQTPAIPLFGRLQKMEVKGREIIVELKLVLYTSLPPPPPPPICIFMILESFPPPFFLILPPPPHTHTLRNNATRV